MQPQGRAAAPSRAGRRPRSRGYRAAILVVIAVLLAATGCGSGAPGKQAGPPLGAFLGSGADGAALIGEFGTALGVDPTVGHAYLPGNTGSDLEGGDWVLDPWTAWLRAESGRMFVLNVPMVTPNEPALPDDRVAALLRAGAAGAQDAHFRTLAQRLVERGAAGTVIVPGWEMNGTTYSSRCAPDPAAWKGYWRRIVQVMRSVPGQHFRFDFAPVRGTQAIGWTACYPGDDVVDIIGMDSYDQPPGRTFDDFVSQPYGLRAQADFAAAHHKPMSYPEWGLFDYGDNPGYIRSMHAWFLAHDVVYQTITDYCPHGVWECRDNPKSREAYQDVF